MSRLINITGQKFGRLTVLGLSLKRGKRGEVYWECQCNCGEILLVRGSHLRYGETQSCGCLNKESSAKINSERKGKLSPKYRHGRARDSIYEIWCGIKARCYRKNNNPAFKNYGGRGIKICDSWLDPERGFENFLEDMGERPGKNYSIERKDNDGDYTPENCKWATSKEQNNNKRSNIWIEYNGEKKTLKEWARKLEINYHTLYMRIFYSLWPINKAFNFPSKENQK